MTFDEARARRDVKDLNDLVNNKRKEFLLAVKNIENLIEKQFYNGTTVDVPQKVQEKMFHIVEENEEPDHTDLEMQEQDWFNTQIEWTKKIGERKGATHRYIKDTRPASSKPVEANSIPSSARGASRQRKKLEEAIKFTKK